MASLGPQLGPSWAPPGAILDASWSPPWAFLGLPCRTWGPSGVLLGPTWGTCEATPNDVHVELPRKPIRRGTGSLTSSDTPAHTPLSHPTSQRVPNGGLKLMGGQQEHTVLRTGVVAINTRAWIKGSCPTAKAAMQKAKAAMQKSVKKCKKV